MSSSSSGKKSSSAVTVGVRIRPLNGAELSAGMPAVFAGTEDRKQVEELDEDGDLVKAWPFDHVFGNDCNNAMIFKTCGKTLVESALDGFNTVLFMYGQTSSGKTFTLFGGGEHQGLVTHAMDYVHKLVTNSVDKEYIIKLTYAELYNEELKDLLSETPNENLKIIEDPMLGPIIQNITERPFSTAEGVKQLLEEGEQRRHFGVTNMNAHSSRSHVLVRLGIEARKVATKPANPLRTSWGKDKPTSISTLNLVDLAGSERASKSGTSGESLKEGSFINKSLLTLGTVIASLTDKSKSKHVPYRDSKLTRLLASALGGNAKTCMLTCISPASGNLVESLSTLRFATRAKRVVNSVQKNEFKDAKALSKQMAQQQAQIEALQKQIQQGRESGFGDDPGAGNMRETALKAAKKWRTVKFMMVTMPRIIDALKASGKSNVAKKIAQETKMSLSTGHMADGTFDFVSESVATHLPRETHLMDKLEQYSMRNESNSLAHEDDEGSDEEMFGAASSGDAGLTAFDFDADDLRQALEKSRMEVEEMRVLSAKVDAAMAGMKKDMIEQEKLSRRANSSEVSAKNDLKELRQVIVDERAERKSAVEGLQAKIDKSRTDLIEKDAAIADVEAKNVELEKSADHLRSQLMAMSKDLGQTERMRKNYENEVLRVKNEMKVQMERLRQNMGSMLKEGGEESKHLSRHNMQLQMDLDSRNDEIALLKEQLSYKDDEINAVRAELHNYLDDMKRHTQENYMLKEQIARHGDKTRELESDIVRMTTEIGIAEQRVHDAAERHRDILMAKEHELENLKSESKIVLEAADKENSELAAKLVAAEKSKDEANSQLSYKKLELARVTKDKKSEIARLDRKQMTLKHALDMQRKTSSELIVALEKRNEELEAGVREWKAQAETATQWVEQVNGFFDHGGDVELSNNSDEEDEYRLADTTADVVEVENEGRSQGDGDVSTYGDDGRRYSFADSIASLVPSEPESVLDQEGMTMSPTPIKLASPSKAQTPLLDKASLDTAVRFASLRHALMIATKGLKHCMADESVMREHLLEAYTKECDNADEIGADLIRYNTATPQVLRYRKHLESTVRALEARADRAEERAEGLLKEMSGYQNQNKDLLVHTAFLSKRSDMQKAESEGLRIQNEKLRFDLMEVHAGLERAGLERDAYAEDLQHSSNQAIDLSRELGTLNQKYFVMEAERDELMKTFAAKYNRASGEG